MNCIYIFLLWNLETALAGGDWDRCHLSIRLPNVSTQSRVFISGNKIQGMVTYIPVGGGGAGEMAMGGKNGREAKSVGGHVGHGWCSE